MTRERIASYEDARASLRLGCGLRICRQFIVSEHWLAFGKAAFGSFRSRLYLGVGGTTELSKEQQALPFSKGFSECFASQAGDIQKQNNPLFPNLTLSYADNLSTFRNALDFSLQTLLKMLEPEEAQKRFLWTLTRCAFIHYAELSSRVSSDPLDTNFQKVISKIEDTQLGDAPEWFFGYKIVPNDQKINLTTITEVGNVRTSMRNILPDLLARLRRATSSHGMKTKLAHHMEVPLTNVSQWLSGVREPGGETTLRLLQWVEAQEQITKQKTPGGATNTSKGETTLRKRKVCETKPSPKSQEE